MPEQKKHNLIVKHEPASISRVSKSLEITNKLLTVTEELFLIPYRKGDKWGFCDKNKKIVIPCNYTYLKFFDENGTAIVQKDYKFGFIDGSENQVVPFSYDYIEHCASGYFLVYQKKNVGIIDETGRIIISPKYTFIDVLGYNSFLVGKDDYYQIVDRNESVLFQFDQKLFSYECAAYYFDLNTDYEQCFPRLNDRDYLMLKSSGLIRVKENDKYGLIDIKGNIVLYCNYDLVKPIRLHKNIKRSHQGFDLIAVKNNEKFGFLNSRGKQVIPPQYDGFSWERSDGKIELWNLRPDKYYDESYDIEVEVDYKSNICYITLNNSTISINFPDYSKYSSIGLFSEGIAVVFIESGTYTDKRTYGYIDSDFNEIAPLIYEDATDFLNGIAFVKKDGKYGIINRQGKLLTQFMYSLKFYFGYMDDSLDLGGGDVELQIAEELDNILNRNFADSHKHVKWEYLADSRKSVIAIDDDDLKYRNAESPIVEELGETLNRDYILVKRKDQISFFQKVNSNIQQCDFSEDIKLIDHTKPLFAVCKGTKWGIVDILGNLVVPFIYDEIDEYSEGMAIVESAKEKGFINTEMLEVIPCKYIDIDPYSNGFAKIYQNNTTNEFGYHALEFEGIKGYIDKTGTEFWDD